MAPFFCGGKKEDSSSFSLKWEKILTLKDETKPLSWISHNYLQPGRCSALLCTLQSTFHEFFHSEPLDYPVAFSSQICINPYWDWMVFFPLLAPFFTDIKVKPSSPSPSAFSECAFSCQECWRINTLILKCDTGLKIPLEQKGEGHILICTAIASLWSYVS